MGEGVLGGFGFALLGFWAGGMGGVLTVDFCSLDLCHEWLLLG